MLKKIISVFLAFGDMFSLAPRERPAYACPFTDEDMRGGVNRHFEAVWGFLERALADYEKQPR